MRAAPPHGAPTYAVQRGGGAPVLSAASSGVLVQALGQFEFQVGFSVLPAAKGFIIQRIQRTANVTAFDSTDTTVARHTLTAAEIDSLSTVSPNYNGWTQYWEVFNVQSSGASNHDDKFSFSQMDLTKFTNGHTNWSLDWETDGLYSIQGVATYYPGTLPAGIFKKGNAGNPAAGCPWTTSDPATHTALGTIVGPSAGLTHTASITWRGQTAQTLTYGIAGVTTAVTA